MESFPVDHLKNANAGGKGVAKTGRGAKGVAKTGRNRAKTAEEKEAEHKRMCDMLRQ
jgi:hypothetical protein